MEHPTWIGRTLGNRYKIERLLGQGGMSAVYKAHDPNLKRVVAIKLIHEHLSTDPSFVQRFESEAAAVASLRHPNIVQVFDFNNDGGVYYMVLEYIEGETLQDRMKRLSDDGQQLSLAEAIKIITHIADAVNYAHQHAMIHRDIKPANIMLGHQGQAILMDFGIVKITGGERHTATGALVGTARYMPPELIRGGDADSRSDIYSLGITLYEALSGRPPFVADSAMTLMMMHLHNPVPDVRDFRSGIQPELVTILENCLAKEPDDRYQSAAELSADLRRVLADLGEKMEAPASASITRKAERSSLAIQEPIDDATSTMEAVPIISQTAETANPIQQQAKAFPKNIVIGIVVTLVLIGIFAFGRGGKQNDVIAEPSITPSAEIAQALIIPPTGKIVSTPTETPLPIPTAIPTKSFPARKRCNVLEGKDRQSWPRKQHPLQWRARRAALRRSRAPSLTWPLTVSCRRS
jgi:serine/threonine-protein kinase